jgi:hypothetical protein
MPFGLTNVPATFQALMNNVLRPFLPKFVLVFFDEILIFSPSWAEHLQHVRAVLTKLREHQLFMKKCSFMCSEVPYLGHVISAAGMAMDEQKVRAVEWPMPQSVHAVRAFLGLVDYYRRFIWDYGAIATPFTALLRKDGFRWSAEAKDAFWALQRALTTASVLQLPNFGRDFIVECNAFGSSFGAVLHQGNGPITFFNK